MGVLTSHMRNVFLLKLTTLLAQRGWEPLVAGSEVFLAFRHQGSKVILLIPFAFGKGSQAVVRVVLRQVAKVLQESVSDLEKELVSK